MDVLINLASGGKIISDSLGLLINLGIIAIGMLAVTYFKMIEG